MSGSAPGRGGKIAKRRFALRVQLTHVAEMTLRQIPAELAPEIVGQIDQRLDDVCRDHRVRMLLAIESGSRAWGFPSPDSDYDCRFVFVRSVEDYLSPWSRRDVIETPLDAVLDVNGWSLAKR